MIWFIIFFSSAWRISRSRPGLRGGSASRRIPSSCCVVHRRKPCLCAPFLLLLLLLRRILPHLLRHARAHLHVVLVVVCVDDERGWAFAVDSWPPRVLRWPRTPGLWSMPLTRAELARAEGTGRARAGAGWWVSHDGLCEVIDASAGVDGGALRCAACLLAMPYCPKTLHARFASSSCMAARRTNARPAAQNQHAAFLKALLCAIACGLRG